MEQINEPVLKLHPQFSPLGYFVNKHLATLLALFFLMYVAAQSKANFTSYFLLTIALYLTYVIINCFITSRKYKKIEYLFYYDKIIILNRNKKGQDNVVYYKDAIDILMSQSYSQKFLNQGNLIIKLEQRKFMGKSVNLISIGNFEKNTQKIYDIIYGNGEEE